MEVLSLGEIPDVKNFNQIYYKKVQELWNDTAVRECYRRSNEFQLIDSAK